MPKGDSYSRPKGVKFAAVTDEPDNIVLRYLRHIDEKVDRLIDDMRELKERLGTLEANYASVSRRIDRIEVRLDRIEKRLDLAEA